jgi:hypothetical protein
MTLREEVERDMGLTTKTKINKVMLGPSAWRKTVKYWFVLGVGFCLGSITAGIIVVIAGLT